MQIHFFREFFSTNRFIVLFIYGQVFFILGLSIFLQSRRYSRLKLARHLWWLAGFGFFHGFYEWGLVFIPMQELFMTAKTIYIMQFFHILLLAFSFLFLLKFGLEMLFANRYINVILLALFMLWTTILFYSLKLDSESTEWIILASVWSRYLLGFPGSIAAALGLYKFTREVKLISDQQSSRMLQVAGASLLFYAFFAGIIVPDETFFPANVLNYSLIESIVGIPVEVYRSLIGLVLAYSMIRAMEIFEIEVDHMIEKMEISTIRRDERDRIGQEIHDGVLQSIYSASLITRSLTSFTNNNPDLIERIEQVREVLNQAIVEMREYMVSLRIPKSKSNLKDELINLINQPHFIGLVNVTLDATVKDTLSPSQSGHVIGIVQESLSNIVRHAKAKNVTIIFTPEGNNCNLTIIDDGIGFDPIKSHQGFGLEAIRNRTQLLGGELSIISTPKLGTTIKIHFGVNTQ